MIFADNPKRFINEYYYDKRNTIDLNCEILILDIQEKTNNDISKEMRQNLNKLRGDLIGKIDLAEEKVLDRYDSLSSNYSAKKMKINTNFIKDQIFLDQYCTVFNVYNRHPLSDLKLGLLLFSEFHDDLIEHLK